MNSRQATSWLGDVVISGGASAAREPGYFEVRTSLSQVSQVHFFLHKKSLTTFFSRCPQNTKATNAAEIVSLSK